MMPLLIVSKIQLNVVLGGKKNYSNFKLVLVTLCKQNVAPIKLNFIIYYYFCFALLAFYLQQEEAPRPEGTIARALSFDRS